MGVKLKNPIMVGACGLTADVKTIRELEKAGAGALVTKSLFEEQIELERIKLDEDQEKYNYRNAEMITVFPPAVHQGPREHLLWVKQVKQETGIPVFASLNAVQRDTWIEYAQRLEATGVDGLECNFFATPGDAHRRGIEIEDDQADLVAELKKRVSIPLCLKLSPFYTNIAQVVHRLDQAGADAVVLFNRLFEPDIDLEREYLYSPFHFSRETDHRLPLRYAGLLQGNIHADICCSTGIAEGAHVVKMILAGATAVQTVSALYRHGPAHIGVMLESISEWMEKKGHSRLADFRGNMSRRNIVGNPWAYTRAQYVKLLMNPEHLVKNAPVI